MFNPAPLRHRLPPILCVLLLLTATAHAHEGHDDDHASLKYLNGDYEVTLTQLDPPVSASSLANAPLARNVTYGLIIHVGGRPVKYNEIRTTHGRSIHTVLASANGQYFAHEHPADFAVPKPTDTQFLLRLVFPAAGQYVLAVDFQHDQQPGILNVAKRVYIHTEKDPHRTQIPFPSFIPASGFSDNLLVLGMPFASGQRYMHTIDMQSTVFLASSLQGTAATAVANAPHVLQATMLLNGGKPFASGDCVPLLFKFTHPASNMPVNDLQLFLHAPSHFMIHRRELDVVVHTHGSLPTLDARGIPQLVTDDISKCGPMMMGNMTHTGPPTQFGPYISVYVSFQTTGNYAVIIQVARNGHFYAFPFHVPVTALESWPGDSS